MKTILAVSLLLLAGCAMPEDPCPLPPEQHSEAWRPITTSTGQIIGYACGTVQ